MNKKQLIVCCGIFLLLVILGGVYFAAQYINAWKVLGGIAIILLIIYFHRRRNAVWGGLTMGAIVGLIIAVFLAFMGKGFDWHIIVKATTVGIMAGFIAELLGDVSKLIER